MIALNTLVLEQNRRYNKNWYLRITDNPYMEQLNHTNASKKITEYLNSIDFSLVNDTATVENIYLEILPVSSMLCKDPFACTSLEKLLALSSSEQLIKFLSSLEKRTIHGKIGSRIVEKVFERLFDCFYKHNDRFDVEKIKIDFGDCIMCHNATFVVRKALMLITGKHIDKLKVTKYNHDHKEYSDSVIQRIKQIYLNRFSELAGNDTFNTLGIFLLISKSQTLIKKVIEKDLTVENIKNRGFFYEMIPTVASKKNLQLIFDRLKGTFRELALCDSSQYFVQSFLRNSDFSEHIFREFFVETMETRNLREDSEEIEEFSLNSNAIVALFERLKKPEMIDWLVKEFYHVEGSLFDELLLHRHGSLDSKFVNVVVKLMKMPQGSDYSVNSDFLKKFEKEWIKNKTGISLLIGFVEGSADSSVKAKFLEKHIDLLWNCCKWKEGKRFMKRVCSLIKGHPRKKAFEILEKCEF